MMDLWDAARRLIPACAGKTIFSKSSIITTPAHPRVCGENQVVSPLVGGCEGSSPRVRGKPPITIRVHDRERLIPACAGKTTFSNMITYSVSAHPRVCGENCPAQARRSERPGSSPRVRGKPARRGPAGLRRGLIPACAGKTRGRPGRAPPRGAHPRVCGENSRTPFRPPTGPGSSPRVRGKRAPHKGRVGKRRLIPACAGKTEFHAMPPRSKVAHPRVCGENQDGDALALPALGSSPRVRGKLHDRHHRLGRAGLIPACAGKTTWV